MGQTSLKVKNDKNGLVLALTAGILLIKGWFFLGVLVVAMAVKRLFYWTDETSEPLSSGWNPTGTNASMDSQKWGLQIPRDPEVRDLLNRVYRRYHVGQRRYPHLKETFDQLIASMWENLSLTEDPRDWKWVLRELLKEWPIKADVHMNDLKQKIRDARLAAQQWSEARHEAWGLNSQ